MKHKETYIHEHAKRTRETTLRFSDNESELLLNPLIVLLNDIRDFYKFSIIQECQYYKLCFSCAIRKELDQ